MPRLYLGTRKGLFRLSPENGRWQVSDLWFFGDHVSMLLVDPRDGSIYAALNHGHFGAKLHRSRDDGATWTEIPAPAFPPKPEDVDEKDMWGRPLPWSLQQVWAMEIGQAPGELWCGTIPGGLFHSRDGGDSWQINEPLWFMPDRKKWMGGGADYPGIHSLCLHPRDGNRLIAGVSCGGAWLTEDGGATWKVRSQGMRAEYMPPDQAYDPIAQDPHLVVQCRDQPEKLWSQHHNGIFRSIDEGVSWTEVKNENPSAFGFAVAVDPRDGDTAWFVPATSDQKRVPVAGRVVVTRTRDGGQTFEQLTSGLPQQHAYDITYRHSLTIDSTGDKLAFGSTTGSCWTTIDGGDSWQCVGQHLPPIYCAKFDAKN